MSNNNIESNNDNQVKSVLEQAISHLNIIVEDSGLLKELSEEKKAQLLATIKVCSKTAYLLLKQVFNKSYYPLMTDGQEAFLMNRFIIYCVLNVIYPYSKDAKTIHHIIKIFRREIDDFCVESCLLYILDEHSYLYSMLEYLSETFYQFY